MSDPARAIWTETRATMLRCTREVSDLMKTTPSEADRKALSSRVRTEMYDAAEATRAALRAELDLQAEDA